MKYVYILESINFPAENYIGLADDLRNRLAAHNAGQSTHTRKFKPWRLVTYVAFSDEAKAVAFERYLKSSVALLRKNAFGRPYWRKLSRRGSVGAKAD